MIYEQLARIDRYRALSPSMDRAIRFIHETDLATLPAGRCEVDGDRVYGMMLEYTTTPDGPSRWESHRKYIDLQLLLAGEEKMLVSDAKHLHGAGEYDVAKDVIFYASAERSLAVDALSGEFVVFFPHDCHRAMLAVRNACPIRKLVLKVAAS